jgi:muramoyltetrapeptide carboxypeptidase
MILTPSGENRIRLTGPLHVSFCSMAFRPKRLLKPRPLRRGGHIAVLAISSPSEPARIDRARSNLERLGFRVTIASNAFDRVSPRLAGSDDVRARHLNRYLRDDRFDAFLFTRGGYGAMRILDRIDYGAIRKNPRPIIGYSDLTALHQAVACKAGVATFHGPMLNLDFHDRLTPEMQEWFWALLGGEAPLKWSVSADQFLQRGKAEGVLFGGCLSLTQALIGTPYDYWVKGGIWFWEDVDEPAYRIDRMLTHLRLSGRLQTIEGLMIGQLKDCGKDDPSSLEAVLAGHFRAAGIPLLRDLPFGHFGNNLTMPIGTRVRIDARGFTVLEPAVDPSLEGRR